MYISLRVLVVRIGLRRTAHSIAAAPTCLSPSHPLEVSPEATPRF